MPTETSLERELKFARMKLAAVASDVDAPASAIAALLTETRLLATAQAELCPGSGLGGKSFELKFTVVGGEGAGAQGGDAAAAPPVSELETQGEA